VVRVVMGPGRVVAGIVTGVVAVMMSERPAPRASMGSVRPRVMGVRRVGTSVVPMAAMSVRTMPSVPMPAMSAAGERGRRSSLHQADDRR
jgi:hypothetical protein